VGPSDRAAGARLLFGRDVAEPVQTFSAKCSRATERKSRGCIFCSVFIPERLHFLQCLYSREDPMKKLFAVLLISAVVTPALAEEFYVVRDATTKKCTIVDKKPTVTTTTVVGNTVYKTRSEAEGGMKTVKVCTEK
jgi:hypothetical protein